MKPAVIEQAHTILGSGLYITVLVFSQFPSLILNEATQDKEGKIPVDL